MRQELGTEYAIPPLEHNFDNCRHYLRQHIPQGQQAPYARIRNYESAYRNTARTLCSLTGQVAGPIDIRKVGNERLLAEFWGKPGTRTEDIVDDDGEWVSA